MKYIKQKNGEWVQPIRRGYKMMCCDCGLVHKMNFRIKRGRIQFQASRDYRATGQARRKYETIRVIKQNRGKK